MKRIFLIRNVAPNKFGGGETYQLMLADLLKKSGFEPYILTASRKLLEEATIRNIKTIKTPYSKKQNWSGSSNLLFYKYYFFQRRLKKFYRRVFELYNPNVVNIQSRDDWIAATLAAQKDNIKVLWTDHIDFRTWVFTNVNVWYKNLIGKWILRVAPKAERIIFISDFEYNWFINNLGRSFTKLMTIKNGVIDCRFKYKSIQPAKYSFGFVGRVVDYKGIFELISAFLKIVQDFPTATLNIYGEGEALEKCKKITKNQKQITFYGYTNEPLKAIAENEVFVLPSYKEGLSLSLLDATMLGKKIIATNVDGNPEIVEDKKTGLLVPAKNVDKLVEAMRFMLENPNQAEEFAKNARCKYEKEFNFDKIFDEKMLPLYNDKKE